MTRIRVAETVTRKRVVEVETSDMTLVRRLLARVFPRLVEASPPNDGRRRVGSQWVRDRLPESLAASIAADRSRVRARSIE